MKALKPVTAHTLTWLAVALMVAGLVIMSPSGSMILLLTAFLSAFFPAMFGKGAVRYISAALLFISIGLAVGKYPSFKHEQEVYRHRMNTPSQQQPLSR